MICALFILNFLSDLLVLELLIFIEARVALRRPPLVYDSLELLLSGSGSRIPAQLPYLVDKIGNLVKTQRSAAQPSLSTRNPTPYDSVHPVIRFTG